MFTKIVRASAASRPPTRPQFDATLAARTAPSHGRSATRWPRSSSGSREQLGGVDRVSLQMTNPRLAHGDLLRGIELLGTEVAPRVAG